MGKDEIPLIIKVQEYLNEKFEFRYNVVLGRTEFKLKEAHNYSKMVDYNLNSIHLGLKEAGYRIGVEELRNLLKSRYVPMYNPFKQYFEGLPMWDEETDHISMLASTVKTTNDDFWQFAFKKWFVGMVGSLLVDEVINHSFLIFTGNQGIGKTTFMEKLVPKELKEYYYEGTIYPSSSDSKIQLAENMLINIDELQGLYHKTMEDLKALITTKEVKVRRPYATIHEPLPHRASFVGSANSTDFLSDVTGNRRFLCFEVLSIDNSGVISMNDVYAQAKHLFESGFRYWFNQEEIALINENSEGFKTNSMEEDTLLKCIEPCEEHNENAQFGTTTEIMSILVAYEPKIRVNQSSLQKLGKLLSNKYEFRKVKKGGVYGYFYKRKNIISRYVPVNQQ